MKTILNKKGDSVIIPVGLFVISMIVLSIAVLGLFLYNHAKFQANLYDSSFVDSLNYKEEQINSYANLISESAIIGAYSDVVSQNGAKILDSSVKDDFVNHIKQRMGQTAGKYTFNDDLLNLLKNRMTTGDFQVSSEGDIVTINLGEYVINSEIDDKNNQAKIKAVYNPKEIITFNLTEERLHGFDAINGVLISCKSITVQNDFQKCLNDNLINFNSIVSESQGKKSIQITTKGKYLIDGQLKQIFFTISFDGQVISSTSASSPNLASENVQNTQNPTLNNVIQKDMVPGDSIDFNILDGESHKLTFESFSDDGSPVFLLESQPMAIKLVPGQIVKVDLNGDGYADAEIVSIKKDSQGNIMSVSVRIINDPIDPEWLTPQPVYLKQASPNKGTTPSQTPSPSPSQTKTVPPIVPTPAASNLDWVNKLPIRKELPTVEYGNCPTGYPCGPSALYSAFRELGKEVNPCDLSKMRLTGIRGAFTKFLGLFNPSATDITWPGQIVDISKSFGYNVEVISGQDANINTIRARSTDNSVVIALLSLDSKNPLTSQHYETYQTNFVKQTMSSDNKYPMITGSDYYGVYRKPYPGEDPILMNYLIRKVFVLSKPGSG